MKTQTTKYNSYSDILLQLISPLLGNSEDEELIMQLALLGMLAWNYTFLDKMPPWLKDPYLQVVEECKRTQPEGRWIFDLFCARKKELFDDYHQYILKVTRRTEGKVKDGYKNLILRVESAPIDKIFGRN